MPFSEQLKLSVKKKAHFACCLCHDLSVEIHHIDPQHEGGPDSEENAAPLCPSCHERYGANPQKRKFIREVRDFWYELCASRFRTDAEQFRDTINGALKNVATKEDLERLVLWNSALVLGSSSSEGKIALEHLRYSFVREEYVHPRILQELQGWISDRNSTIVGIDLAAANRSNRFGGPVDVVELGDKRWIRWSGHEEGFEYRYIASSPSGIHIVESRDWGGGSGSFGNVLLLSLTQERCLDSANLDTPISRDQIVIKILGQIPLGDRYSGKIDYEDGVLMMGPDEGWFKQGDSASKRFCIH